MRDLFRLHFFDLDFARFASHTLFLKVGRLFLLRVFLLPPWEEIYTSDAERYESFEEATKIHAYLVDTYTKYGYDLHEVPKTSVAERFQFIINHIKD